MASALSPKRAAASGSYGFGRGERTDWVRHDLPEGRCALDYEDFTYRRGWRTYENRGLMFAPEATSRKSPRKEPDSVRWAREKDAAIAEGMRDKQAFFKPPPELKHTVSTLKFDRKVARKLVHRRTQKIAPAHEALRRAASPARRSNLPASGPAVVTLEATQTPLTAAEVIAARLGRPLSPSRTAATAPTSMLPTARGAPFIVPRSAPFEEAIRQVKLDAAKARSSAYAGARLDVSGYLSAKAEAAEGSLIAANGGSVANLRRTFRAVQAAAFENTRADLLPSHLKPGIERSVPVSATQKPPAAPVQRARRELPAIVSQSPEAIAQLPQALHVAKLHPPRGSAAAASSAGSTISYDWLASAASTKTVHAQSQSQSQSQAQAQAGAGASSRVHVQTIQLTFA
jgi:hypothetical protein